MFCELLIKVLSFLVLRLFSFSVINKIIIRLVFYLTWYTGECTTRKWDTVTVRNSSFFSSDGRLIHSKKLDYVYLPGTVHCTLNTQHVQQVPGIIINLHVRTNYQVRTGSTGGTCCCTRYLVFVLYSSLLYRMIDSFIQQDTVDLQN